MWWLCNFPHLRHGKLGKKVYSNALVIWNSGPYGAGDSGNIAGLKCHDLTSNESWQCPRSARVFISCQNALHAEIRATSPQTYFLITLLILSMILYLWAVSSEPHILPWKRYRLIFMIESRLFQETKNRAQGGEAFRRDFTITLSPHCRKVKSPPYPGPIWNYKWLLHNVFLPFLLTLASLNKLRCHAHF